ncbi:family 78 glycoside hydrolase catalytic domain [Nonomuraea soli]|uniref:alpha-L-rhamnosidase n=1 Tax=Nonomuraea soli TaxID=1032476 RepID=A0A7W0CFS3_9ACTN|nr:family 78 glycoside hydrolase catalytic domain [Nonomuraea soli]MBA2890192.1 alpha-L-rhamnosidase [Nonomuraea soli]
MTSPHVRPPTFEHHREPLGIGEATPRLSWVVDTGLPGWRQQSYEIELSDGTTTGVVESSQSVLVAWPGAPLGSRERRGARVRVQDSDWSPWSWVETGLLRPSDWRAAAASPPRPAPPDGPAFLLRRAFTLTDPVAARLYVTAFGLYELEINGSRVGDAALTPGWSSYEHRLRYRTHDVTALLRAGSNTVEALLADGWYRGRIGFGGGRTEVYGTRTALIAQLEITEADGTLVTIGTDRTWQCAPSPVTATGLYDGETHDARREPTGWLPADELPYDPSVLVAPAGPPVRNTEVLEPVQVLDGGIVDFGQNISGRLRITARGTAGRTVTLRHAEVLENGALAVRPLRHAKATDTYILRGDPADPVEEWEPRFTVHGFRYARLDGPVDEVRAAVYHTDLRRTGWFSCSDPLLDRLHENVVWSMRGNFVDLPTDCPQRDERLGWTGDIQVFGPTAAYLYDCAGMLGDWLADLAAEQRSLGTVPLYVPWLELGAITAPRPAAVWGDVAVMLPWTLYQSSGDLELLRRQYPSMTAWVDQVAGRAGETLLWDRDQQLGDWLDPAAPPERPHEALTDPGLVATAYFARSARLLARIAGLLGRTEDSRTYERLAAGVRAAFDGAYVSPEGKLLGETQTGYALALCFDLIDGAERRAHAGARLAELVRAGGHRIGTGFAGTPLICDALTDAGYLDDAYRLLLQTAPPSWLYAVTMGATTIWERWDSLLPDGSVNAGEMTSFNHYALGAVADWMHRVVAGLAPLEPGYRRFLAHPRPGGGLTHARTAHLTPYGRAEVGWEIADGLLVVRVLVPPNTTAEVRLPSRSVEVGSGRHEFRCES